MKPFFATLIAVAGATTLLLTIAPRPQSAESRTGLVVGVATVLSGDLSALGENIVRTVETYQSCCLRHPITFVYEDAKKSSLDGLQAYQNLISNRHVDVLIGGTTSNGTLAAKSLINNSKTPLLTPLTGGRNIDTAGPYVFRIGNSDVLNGREQAELFIAKRITRVALFSEATEYTQDISNSFRARFDELGGKLAYDEVFLPNSLDFRSDILRIESSKPQALFMATQSGLAFGVFVKQLRGMPVLATAEIHTNFLAAENPDAMAAGGEAMKGVFYLKPAYDSEAPQTKEFFARYSLKFGAPPTIGFHTAGTVDSLNLLQAYLDTDPEFSREGFKSFLETRVKNYHGLMGTYSFDREGNSSLGFEPAMIN